MIRSLLFSGLLLTLVCPSFALAAQVELAWDPDPATGLTGYKIYYGVSSRTGTDPKSCGLCGYSTVVSIGNVTTYTVNNLTDGQTYYVSVTAYDSSNNESSFSNEVSGAATSPAQTYSLTVNVSGSGSVTKNPDKAAYNQGDQVTLTAVANSGYSFGGWSGNVNGMTNPVTLTMNGNKTVAANFVPSAALLLTPSEELVVSGNQGGSFMPSTQTYTLQNEGLIPIKWNVSKRAWWIVLSPSSGSLAPGGKVQVTVSINNTAKLLKEGSYNDTIVFRNASNKNDHLSLSVNLTVNPPVKTYTVKTNPDGLQVVVDGTVYTSLSTFDWEVGSSHTLEAPSPQQASSGVQHVFNFWSNRRPQNQTLLAPSSGTTYVATFKTSHLPTAAVDSTEKGAEGSKPLGLANQADGNLPMIGALESPSEGKRVLGLKTIYGWALDGEGVSRVRLFIDGEYICDVPYGGLREDVKELHSGYPDAEKGGFALVWNYSNLPAGAHLVQIDVQNIRGSILSLSANVTVHKLPGENITQVNLGQWLMPGVNFVEDGITKAYDLRLEWSDESQSFEIIDLSPQ